MREVPLRRDVPDNCMRRGALRALGGAAILLLTPLPGTPVSASLDEAWRRLLAPFLGTFAGSGYRQRIEAIDGGFSILQEEDRRIVDVKLWPSVSYRQVGRSGYFSGSPENAIFTDHEVWWAGVDDGVLVTQARFFDRAGRRMELWTRREARNPESILWHVRMTRNSVSVVEEDRWLERV